MLFKKFPFVDFHSPTKNKNNYLTAPEDISSITYR